ncbi:MAG: outer membrane beta-barrel protein [Pseudomonadota bacterium]
MRNTLVFSVLLAAAGIAYTAPAPDTGSSSAPPMSQTSAPAGKSASTLAAATTEAVNESPRERNRVLLKRNPIASEYQLKGSFGRAPGSATDSESVDFRRFFSLNGRSNQSQWVISSTRQQESGDVQPGGRLTFRRALTGDADHGVHLAAQVGLNAADRIIDEYAGRWNVRGDTDGVPALAFARYTTDHLETESLTGQLRLSIQNEGGWRGAYHLAYTDYVDDFHRNRTEFQFVRGTPDPSSLEFSADGQSLVAGTFENGGIRRYFHDLATRRTVQRHQFSAAFEDTERSFSAIAYWGEWDNQRDWDGWNFFQSGVAMSYRTSPRWEPTLATTDPDFDLYDLSAAPFANLRLQDVQTVDTDMALKLDFEQAFELSGHSGWWSAGVQWRTKERDDGQERLVFGPGPEAPSLGELALRRETDLILDGNYLLPGDLSVPSTRARFLATEGSSMILNEALTFSESLQQQYLSEETVSAAYLSAYQTIGAWRWKAGLRYERTRTETLGSLVGPPEFVAEAPGELVNELQVQGRTIVDSFDVLDAKRVPGGQRYDHVLPSVELSYALTTDLQVLATAYRVLMRPQYFDIVDYRRIIIPVSRIQEGNPDLVATTIDNYAVALEYRSAQLGSLAAELYRKSINDFFYDAISNEVLDGILFDVTRVENGETGRIDGFQLSWDQSIEPDALTVDRLSFETAYTYSNSRATIRTADGSTRRITVPERSRHFLTGSVSATLGSWRFGLRGSYQSVALDNVGNAAGRDRFRRYFVQVGANIGVTVFEDWRLDLRLNNLTNHPERSFDGASRRALLNQYAFPSAQLSITRSL